MASSEELRRLVLHAADQLDGVDIAPSFERLSERLTGIGAGAEREQHVDVLVAATAAIAQAKATLRLVAACMAVEEPERAGGDR